MSFRPLGDRVVIRPDEPKKVDEGDLIDPENGKGKPRRGEVISVGPGKSGEGFAIPLQVTPGNHVEFEPHAAKEMKIDGEDLLIVREHDIIGVL